ncbi:TRADD-N-associated membrane domain-containing protein [Thiocystis violacea]|uniref:TRADD-N-associated membrane domain-containing protein n=1 Tax=Thiocystis violacea TaxID=13725 RepID=UPI00190522F8|nr:hypothetical protein [Thiocystis violacea]MBK1719576.1 hypothetical protein [Thiocystis violacea]
MAEDKTINLIDEYYHLNIQHLRWSFWSSIVALFVGLGALVAGIFLVLRGDANMASQLTVIAGVLTQFIGVGFFYLYRRNLKLLSILFEKLIKHRDTLFAIQLTREMPEDERFSGLKALIGNLLSRGEPPTDPTVLKAIIDSNNKTTR